MTNSASPRDITIDCLLSYPALFQEKWQVYEHLFAVLGNGYDWNEDGKLIEWATDPRSLRTMEQGIDFTDLEKLEEDCQKMLLKLGVTDMKSEFATKFLQPYKDRVLDAKIRSHRLETIVNTPLFVSDPNIVWDDVLNGVYLFDGACYPKDDSYGIVANTFSYPKNITKEWASNLLDFVRFWLFALQIKEKASGKTYPELEDALVVVKTDLENRS